jgi:hypothetical protein
MYPSASSDTARDRWSELQKDAVDRLADLYKVTGFTFVRKERLGDKNTGVYEQLGRFNKGYKCTAWVDLDTKLPVRFEIVFPPADMAQFRELRLYGLRLADFSAAGSATPGWIDLKPGEPRTIYDEFKWNASLDTSLFSTVPPADYSVEVYTDVWDVRQPRGYWTATDLAKALSTWLSLSGNVFPDDIHDLIDSTKVKPILLRNFRRGEDPMREFRAAYKRAGDLADYATAVKGIDYYRLPSRYLGKGARAGDPKMIVYWFKYKDEPYFVIYADLHVATSVAPPTPAKE